MKLHGNLLTFSQNWKMILLTLIKKKYVRVYLCNFMFRVTVKNIDVFRCYKLDQVRVVLMDLRNAEWKQFIKSYK